VDPGFVWPDGYINLRDLKKIKKNYKIKKLGTKINIYLQQKNKSQKITDLTL